MPTVPDLTLGIHIWCVSVSNCFMSGCQSDTECTWFNQYTIWVMYCTDYECSFSPSLPMPTPSQAMHSLCGNVVQLVREETTYGEFKMKEAWLISCLLPKTGQNYTQMAPICLRLIVWPFRKVFWISMASYIIRRFMTPMPSRPCMLKTNGTCSSTENITS